MTDSVSSRERAERLARAFQRLYNAALAVDDQDTGTLDEFRAARDVLTPDAVLALVKENERLREANPTITGTTSSPYPRLTAENERLRSAHDFHVQEDGSLRWQGCKECERQALVVEGDE